MVTVAAEASLSNEKNVFGCSTRTLALAASVMTTLLKGKSQADARALFERFHGMITSDHNAPLDSESLGKLAVFGGVREYPIRIKCATLPWHTMLAALKGKRDEPVSTE